MKPRKYAMEPPEYVIPASAFAIVVYTKERAVGFQYQNPNGTNVFVAVPGQCLSWLIDDMEELIGRMPEIEEWELPSVSYATAH